MIKLMCTNCYEVTELDIERQKAKYDYGKCNNCKCGNNVHIDDKMIDLIVDLNKKGYETQFCCEGHIDNSVSLHTYIIIKRHIKLPYIPKDFDVEFIDNKFGGKRTYICGKNHCLSDDEEINEDIKMTRSKMKEYNLKEMRKLVDSLPVIK